MFILDALQAIVTAMIYVIGVVICGWLFVVVLFAPLVIISEMQERQRRGGKE